MVGAHNSKSFFKDGTPVTAEHFRPVVVTSALDHFNRSLTSNKAKRRKKAKGKYSTATISQDEEQKESLLVRCLLNNEPRHFKLRNIVDAITLGVDANVAKGADSLNGRWRAPFEGLEDVLV